MFNDRVIRWLTGVMGALLLVLGLTVSYSVLKPELADARTYSVELTPLCNAFIVGERPWCAEVFKVKGDYLLGVVEKR